MYTCLNKLGIKTARATCRNTIRLHRGLFKWTKCTKQNESILLILVLLHLFLYSYNFLFQIQSSSSTDSSAKSRSRGSGIFSPIQCSILGPLYLYKALMHVVYTRRDKWVESCDAHRYTGYKITKNTMYTYLQLPNTPVLGQDYLKCKESI
jgi:hypothetical protein